MTRADSSTEFADLLAAARDGDGTAWGDLYRRHAPAVLGYLRAQRLPHAEDVLGEVWLHVVRDLHTFHGDEGGFRAWLMTIAHHRLLDARRAAARRPELDDAADAPELADPASSWPAQRLDAQERLQALLGDLPDRQRTVLYLRFVLDMSQQDVAEVLGVSTPAMKMLQARSLRSLQHRVDELERDALPFPSDTRSGR